MSTFLETLLNTAWIAFHIGFKNVFSEMFIVNKQRMHCLSVMADIDGEELTASKDFKYNAQIFLIKFTIFLFYFLFLAAAVLQEEYKN